MVAIWFALGAVCFVVGHYLPSVIFGLIMVATLLNQKCIQRKGQ